MTYRQNKLFSCNQKLLYKELGGKKETLNEAPDKEETRRFWEGIWSEKGNYNRNANWISDFQDYVEEIEVDQMKEVDIGISDVVTRIKKMANWKAPGPDGVRGFWFKQFSSVHGNLAEALARCIQSGEVPDWMVKGRTVLIQKDKAKGPIASNFRPITCLPLMWKLLTGILSEKIYKHLDSNGLLPEEQKGCRKGSKGTKDQLMIDKAVLKDAKKKHRFLSMAWIDYRKAFDMVPHQWIISVLKHTKVAGNLTTLLENTMSNWKTELTCNSQTLCSVDIKRGIFQGDSLSPLLFIMAMIPLSFLLKRERYGYKMNNSVVLNHLFYMDDLKLYGKTEQELEELVGIVHRFSEDIGMKFGFEKCASLKIEAGRRKESSGISLPSGEVIKDLDEDGYKYLGVFQEEDIMRKEMKDLVRNEYLRRVKAVCKSNLYAKNLFTAINVWAVSVVRYSAGIIDWNDKELRDLDIKTRKYLTICGAFHKKSSVDRLYLRRSEGGRGLTSVEDCVKMENCNLKEYFYINPEIFTMAANDILFSKNEEETIRNSESDVGMSEGEAEMNGSEGGSNDTTNERVDFPSERENQQIESGRDYKERILNERDERVWNKKMHGKFFREVSNDATPDSYDWVRKGHVKKSTEAYIFAAQEQALPTNWLKARIQGAGGNPICRKCKEKVETVTHLVSGCSSLSQFHYRKRHDKMGLRVYWELCRKYGIQCSDKWYSESPEKVRKSACGNFEIWWDRSIETTTTLLHNKPDVVLINKVKRHWTIIDFAIPIDQNVKKKEAEKLDHYEELAAEIRKMHHVSVNILPLVIGALGVVTDNVKSNLKILEIPKSDKVFVCMQVTAILGTSIILRQVLNS